MKSHNLSTYPEEMDNGIFVYKGGKQFVPKDVVRVRIDPSVKTVERASFQYCKALKRVEFCEGLEAIGDAAFANCTSLEYIRTPSTTRVIGSHAFCGCSSLRNALFHNEGLVEIKNGAFSSCSRLTNVCLPSTMRWLRGGAFYDCQQLRILALNEGLEQVGHGALGACMMLQLVGVPLSVGYIDDGFGARNVRMEVERAGEVWNMVHKHVVETANTANDSAADAGAISELWDDFETISATEIAGSAKEDKLKEETELLHNKVDEKTILKQELAVMNCKLQEILSDMEKIAKNLGRIPIKRKKSSQ